MPSINVLAATLVLALAPVALADSVLYSSSAYTAGDLGQAPTQSFYSTDLTPPLFNILVSPTEEASTNYTLLTYRGTLTTQPAPLIVDNSGSLIWSGAEYSNSMDLLVQTYQGEQVLTFFNGSFSGGGYGYGHWNILSSNYSLIGTVDMAGNQTENTADFHEFVITEDDTALVESWIVTGDVDLSAVNGSTNGYTWDCTFQEIDMSTNEVLFEWRSLPDVAISETYFGISDNAGNSSDNPFDYCHINSIEKDSLSNYLISMRGPSTIYYISGTTGEILWRLGGKNSNFTMGTDASFWYQHDARFHSDTSVSPFNISLFDNAAGGAGDAEATARAIMLSVDTDAMTAELVYSVTPSFNTTAPSQGSNTLMDNGNYFVGWGAVPQFSEYNAAGDLIHDVRFGVPASTVMSYRAFKQAWTGYPTTVPDFTVVANGTTNAYASWNGATEVATWSLMGGSSSTALSSISNVTRSGFETTIPVDGTYAYLAAAALSADGTCLGVTNVFSVSDSESTSTAGSCPNGAAATTPSTTSSGTSASTSSSGDTSGASTRSVSAFTLLVAGVLAALTI